MEMDFINTFIETTEGIPSPKIFRLWAAIATISGALERRIWSPSYATRPTRSNLFITLAGAPGCGKTEAINLCRDLLLSVKDLQMAPDNPTPATFFDALEEAKREKVINNDIIFYSAMSVCARELGVLLPKYDSGFLSALSDIYDCLDTYTAPRRTTKSVSIDRPTVSIVAGVTPAYLGEILPEAAWGQGFCSRMLFIYGFKEQKPDVDVLKPRAIINTVWLQRRLAKIFELWGEVTWSEEAHDGLHDWLREGLTPVPTHSRLDDYRERRLIHVIKLTMISAVSAGRDLFIELEDFERARGWLLDAEKVMPDVFRAMRQKSDEQLISELHYHLYTLWSKINLNERKPIPDMLVYRFLSERVSSERIPRILDMAVKVGKLRQMVGGYEPCPME